MLCLLVAHPPLVAQQERTRPRRQWENLFNLRPERKVTVVLRNGTRKKVRGRFVSSDPNSITVLTKDGQVKTFPRDSVRKVTAERRKVKAAPWIGLAAGAGIMLREGSGQYENEMEMLLGAGIGAGIGAVAGVVVWILTRNAVVYEAPRH